MSREHDKIHPKEYFRFYKLKRISYSCRYGSQV